MATLSTILGILGFPIGLIGFVLGVIFYLHGRRVYRVQYDSVQQEIIRESLDLPSLRLMFGQKRIHSLRIADVAIVNTGTEIIRRSEHSTTNPLVISLPGAEVYGAELVQVSRGECEFDIERTPRGGYQVSFDYMDPTDGCVARFFLGGSSPAAIDISGTFQAAREISRYKPDLVSRYLRRFSRGLLALFVIAIAAAVVVGFAVPDDTEWRSTAAVSSIVVGVLSLLSAYVCASKRAADLLRLSLRLTSEEHYSSVSFLRQRELPTFAPGTSSKRHRRQIAG